MSRLAALKGAAVGGAARGPLIQERSLLTDCTRTPGRWLVPALAVLCLLVPLVGATAPAYGQTTDAGLPMPHAGEEGAAAQAGVDAGSAHSTGGAAVTPGETTGGAQPAFATYRVFATQYAPNTPGSVEVAVPDKCVKFAALGQTGPLAQAACPSGYGLGLDYRVSLTLDNGHTATIPVKDVGPWNEDDNYWDPATGTSRPRRRFTDLPTGTPEAQAAFSNGYNPSSDCSDLGQTPTGHAGDADQFGRCVLNPAGIDLSLAAASQLGLGNLENAWVTVSFLWEPTNTTYVPLTPSRILDTRVNGGKLGAGATRDLTVTGVGGVPTSGVSAVVLNVTVADVSGPESFLTVFPTGSPRPLASTLNMTAGSTVPNLAVARVGSGGMVSIYNNAGTVDVVVDVEGWYSTSAGAGSRYTALPPARVLDTRNGTGAAGPVAGGTSIDVPIAGAGGVPASGVSAVVLNVTATDLIGPETFVTAYPSGADRPLASNLNVVAGGSTANLVVVPVVNGTVSLYNNVGTLDLIADVQGWFGASGATLVAVAPVRALDTRNGTGGTTGAIPPGGTISLTVAGVDGVPASGVTAVVLNVTATDASGPESYLTVFPSGTARPLASNLNFVKGQTVANLVMARVGPDGKVSIYNNLGTVDVVADVEAWFR